VHFTEADKRGRLRQIISPEGADGALAVRQDARVYAGLFNGDEAADLAVAANRHVYVHVARGSVEVNGERLSEGDGARIRNAGSLHFAQGEDAEVLVFDLRPNELPTMPH
jgi:redox-sensitive bicupin YhaK (pirin superfamily)